MKVAIKKLRLRTLIGFEPWETEKKQDVVIDLSFDYDAGAAASSDSVDLAVNYKAICKQVIALVEGSHFALIETLVTQIVALIQKDTRVSNIQVEVEKPHALRFADAVSVTHHVP